MTFQTLLYGAAAASSLLGFSEGSALACSLNIQKLSPKKARKNSEWHAEEEGRAGKPGCFS